jgi:hypothetical protein
VIIAMVTFLKKGVLLHIYPKSVKPKSKVKKEKKEVVTNNNG